jgi:hypothetical protein
MRKRYGFAPLGPPEGPVKQAIFGGNSARLYHYPAHQGPWRADRFAAHKQQYVVAGPARSNLRYGYVAVS